MSKNRTKYQVTAYPSRDPSHIVKETFKKEDTKDRWVENLKANGYIIRSIKKIPVTSHAWEKALV